MGFRLRLTVCIVCLLALSFGIGGAVLLGATFQSSLQEQIDRAANYMEMVCRTLYLVGEVSSEATSDQYVSVLEQMVTMPGGLDGGVLVFRDGASVLYAHGGNMDLSGLSEEENVFSYRLSEEGENHYLSCRRSLQAGAQQFSLGMRFDVTAVYQRREQMNRYYLIAYMLVVGVGALAAGAFSFAMTRRLGKVTGAVRKIAGGDLTARCGLTSMDEFGQLSRDVDAMADKLQGNMEQLQEQMQRQEAFMGAFAHELKTPMTSIIGYADLLRQDGLDDNTRGMAADYIFSEGQRLEKLSFKLLELLLLRQDGLQVKKVNLNRFMQEVDKALGPVMRGKNIRFVCRGDAGTVYFEPDLVKSLLYNLVDNASKAMDGEGLIGVKGSPIPGGVQFQVVDNGRGMAKEELSKITEAFYRVDKARSRAQGGAGLGLALCQEIVELHHGSMKFVSAVGTGTRVTVTLYGKAGETDG